MCCTFVSLCQQESKLKQIASRPDRAGVTQMAACGWHLQTRWAHRGRLINKLSRAQRDFLPCPLNSGERARGGGGWKQKQRCRASPGALQPPLLSTACPPPPQQTPMAAVVAAEEALSGAGQLPPRSSPQPHVRSDVPMSRAASPRVASLPGLPKRPASCSARCSCSTRTVHSLQGRNGNRLGRRSYWMG